MTENAAILRPEISNEIEISNPSEDQFVLVNTKYGHYVKITREIDNLISIVDGKRSIEHLSIVYQDRFEIELSVEFIYRLLYQKLAPYGLLEGYSDQIKPSQKPAYLKLSFILVNERLLNRFTKYLYFLFNAKVAAVVLLLTSILVGLVFATNLNYYKEFNLHNSLIYLFTLGFISVTFHEIGHASAANFFGARHGGIGGGFYLFAPVYFADVTDIWRLPKKQRIVVNLAGMYFEIFLSMVLILISYAIESPFLGIFSALICMKTFTNLNPLIRSDGYWVLSDVSDKPNLHKDALSKIRELYEFVFKGKTVHWRLPDMLLFVYAVISYAFIGYFLYYVLIKNTGSIVYFPKNLVAFVKGIFSPHPKFSFKQYGELLIPVLFFYLLFNIVKEPIKKWLSRLKRG